MIVARRLLEASLHRIVYTILYALVALAAVNFAVPVLREYSGTNEQVIGLGVLLVLVIEALGTRLHRLVDWLLYGSRADPTAVTARLARPLEDTDGATAPLALLEALADTLRLTHVAAVVPDVTGAGGDDVLLEIGTSYGGARTFPIRHAGTDLGELRAARRGEPLDSRDERLLGAAAAQLGLVLHAARLTEELRAARETLVAAGEDERRRLRREIHDGVGPTLAGIALGLESAERAVTRDPARAQALLHDVRADLTDLLDEVRRVVEGLRPPLLDEVGLVGALEQLASSFQQRTGCPVAVHGDVSRPLPAAVEVAAFRIGAEALTNVARHARATHTRVDVGLDGPELVLRVDDDGRGGVADRPGGNGLGSMRTRAEEVGGSLTLTSTPAGTTLTARLPVPLAARTAS
ncbi:signal transduction histidine kinase [Nocardioides ginsengisegetis]|uniref:Signal transduction histidine kinase n=1 Tax=Nocardioides ginsengisegetis TaxID=661491 RepID=A0A7W3J0B3_9ACTN|nr:sensor histidine kinase [Nocardioides ginsengisegetis]MBA8803946.1 signal transduction histidine kinase [Nocardioides ginsengisegetis]